jgi:hypothetical protein
MPPEQIPDSQTLPQRPQFLGSRCVSAHSLPQQVVPLGQHGYLASSYRPTQTSSPGRQQAPYLSLTQTGP